MNMTTDIPPPRPSPKRLPESQRSTYQFPVYRWINWLAVAGYGVGLVFMLFLSAMVGIPTAILWPFFVLVFCVGVTLLDKPQALLATMIFYFLLMPSNRLFGLLGLPLPGFLDELFFVPFIAVIVMGLIQRNNKPSGLWFPALFMGVAAVSWYVNGMPSVFTTVRVTLVMLKFIILWCFCRMTCTFKNLGEFWKWGEIYIHYAALQFLYNCLWQRAPWPTIHPDHSGGVFGPEGTGAAHYVGYISVLALFLLAGWWIGVGRKASKKKRAWMLFLGAVITYDLIFMTDTKHGLFLMPFAFLPFLIHKSVPTRLRGVLLAGGAVVGLCSMFYLGALTGRFMPSRFLMAFSNSPKGDAYLAVSRDFHHLVPYPIFGAGPGRFFSDQAASSGAPLARRYVIPYLDELNRAKLAHFGGTNTRTGASLLAFPQCGFLTLLGEFGWLGASVYLGFIAWTFLTFWQKAKRTEGRVEVASAYLALGGGVLFLTATTLVSSSENVPCLMFPWWMLVGRLWDMPINEDAGKAESVVSSGGGTTWGREKTLVSELQPEK